jgi:hypothetical protein
MGRESNKKRRATNASSVREKAAAARAEQQRADQRRRALMILAGVVAAAIVVVAIVFVAINHKGKSKPGGDGVAAPSAVVTAVQNVSDATLTQIGNGNVVSLPVPVTGEPPLTANGKPEVLYIGAEFCPYCAVERWALAIALSKFGTLSNVGEVRSGTTDGDYASLDFKNATYTSKYITFTPVENQDRNRNTLQKVTAAQNALWLKLTNNQPGFPFIDFGNKYAYEINVPLDPTVLGTLNQKQIAAQLNDPTSKIAQVIGGGANADIAAICSMTGNQPSSVCSSSVISSIQAKLKSASTS